MTIALVPPGETVIDSDALLIARSVSLSWMPSSLCASASFLFKSIAIYRGISPVHGQVTHAEFTIRQERFSIRAPLGKESFCFVYIFHICAAIGSCFVSPLSDDAPTSTKGNVEASKRALDLYDGMSRSMVCN